MNRQEFYKFVYELKDTDIIICSITASRFLGMIDYIYPKIYVYAKDETILKKKKIPYTNLINQIELNFKNIKVINDVKCTSELQTLIDIAKQLKSDKWLFSLFYESLKNSYKKISIQDVPKDVIKIFETNIEEIEYEENYMEELYG